MELGGAAAGETTKSAIVHLERELGYLVHFKRNVNNLSTKTQQLSAAEVDLHRLIKAAEDNNELIRETVKAWRTRAETAGQEARQLLDEAGHVNSWFRGWWCCSRFSLGRKAEKRNAVIQGLLDQRSAIGDMVSMPKPSQSLLLVSAGDFNAFSSRESTAKQVIKALSDAKVSLVGVFGMPGVGKTMLIQAIAKQAKEEKLFEEVVMVTVSQNHMLERIQGDIAKELDLMLREEDNSFIRAARLSERLNQGKTILIVLDDVWETLDLAKAGIDLKNSSNNCCKVVFTTRQKSVCNQMEADESIQVPVLPEVDSWTLFRQKAGKVVDTVISQSISTEIVKECKGLPLAIVTLGLALRNIDDELIWNDTLTQLKKSIFEGMTPVVSSIKLSYNFLQNEAIKLCFLFCCLFPEDHKIDTEILLRYLIGENILKDVNSFEEARGRLQSIIGKLTSSNLLLKDEVRDGYIMMHDVVRDAAISIASEEGFIVKAGMGLTRWPILELNNCKRMSLMRNSILGCDRVKASHLLTLSMRNNYYLKEIPDDLFNEMGSLLTLDLSWTAIKSLPSSLSCLLNLRTLLVEHCDLDCIPPIEKLERLEILSFRESRVCRNTEGIENRRGSLKLLDLSQSTWFQGFPMKLIASAFNLEELYMDSAAEVKSLTQIASLTHLEVLEVKARTARILSQDIPNWEKLTRFNLHFSTKQKPPMFDPRDSQHQYLVDRLYRLPNIKRVLALEVELVVANWLKVLVARTEVLSLSNCEGVDSVTELDVMGLNHLKVLYLDGSSTMKSLISTVAGRTPKFVLSSLEELRFSDVCSLESFCRGMLPDGFFCKLRTLKMFRCNGFTRVMQVDLLSRLQDLEYLQISDCKRLERLIQFEDQSSASKISNCPPSPSFPNLASLIINGCPDLQCVFSLTVARGLLQLRKLGVYNCKSMKMIFSNDTGAEKDKLILPSLKILSISNLWNLSTLILPGLVIHCPRLENLRMFKCHNLKSLPFGSENVPKLQNLEVDLDWFNELEWRDQDFKSHLREVLHNSHPTSP